MDNRNIVGQLTERGDPLSMWAAESIVRLRRKNGELSTRYSRTEVKKELDKACQYRDMFERMWRQDTKRVGELLSMWRPLAKEICRIEGLSMRWHSCNDTKDKVGDPDTIMLRVFTEPSGIYRLDVIDWLKKRLAVVPKKTRWSRFREWLKL